MTDVCIAVLLPTKPSSDDDSGFRDGFRVKVSLALAQSTPALTHINRLYMDCCHSMGLPNPH